MVIFLGILLLTPTVMAASPVGFYGIAHVSVDSISGVGVTKDLKVNTLSLGMQHVF